MLPTRNNDGTDGPVATPRRAQEVARSMLASDTTRRSLVITLEAGTYRLDAGMVLDSNDCLLSGGSVTWRSAPGSLVRITGSRILSGIPTPVDDTTAIRLNPAVRPHILVYDLQSAGMTPYGEITPRGGPGMELYFNRQRMPLARWPDSSWVLIADVPQRGPRVLNEGLAREKRYDGVPVGRHYGRITYDGNRPSRWKETSEILMHGYWTWDWNDSYQQIASIDTVRKEITIAEPHHHYGYTKHQRYAFLNVLEELDRPGEWVLDRHRGRLYFWPPSPAESALVEVSMTTDPLFTLRGCRNLTLASLTIECTRGNAVVMQGGGQNTLAGCTIRLTGGDAVVLTDGHRNSVRSCDISDVAMGGIMLGGGNRMTLEPGDNRAYNNRITRFSQWIATYQVAIRIEGVGNRADHNLMYDAPHEAMYLAGNNHLVEYNEVYDVCTETGDAGAIHTGRDYTWRGNVYRYNYFHHLKGPGLHGVTAIYLDDFSSGFAVYGNVCYRSGRGVLLGGGRDNLVENNIFVECHPSIVLDARGLSWAGYYFDGTYRELETRMAAVNATQPPYGTAYPELLTLYDDEPAVPKNNRIVRNISTGGRWIELLDYYAYDPAVITMEGNLIADQEICKRIREKPAGWEPYYLNLDTEENYIVYRNGDPLIAREFGRNTIIQGDPGFRNVTAGDFHLTADSPAHALGFTSIPFEEIGLVQDTYRQVR